MAKNVQRSRSLSKSAAKSKSVRKTSRRSARNTPQFVEMKGFLSFFILHELASRDLSGDDLANAIGERKGAKLTSGTIYPALKRLRRQKLISYKRTGRRKVYSLTRSGQAELKALYGLLKSMFSGVRSRLKR